MQPSDFEMIDCAWLATDRAGRLAALITAGAGPIPQAALGGPLAVPGIEGRLNELPVSTQAQLHEEVPWPESFVALAERGLYVFDWTDIHRSAHSLIDAYELVASPSQPALLDSLPEDIRRAAVMLDLAFAGTLQVSRTLIPA